MFKISTTSNLAFIFSFALKLILLVAIVTNTLMVLTFTIYLNGLNGQILIKEKSAGVTTLKKYSNFTIDLYTKVPQNLKSIEHIDLNLIHVNETTNTKIILFVNNEANTVGRKGVTYPKSYFVSSKTNYFLHKLRIIMHFQDVKSLAWSPMIKIIWVKAILISSMH